MRNLDSVLLLLFLLSTAKATTYLSDSSFDTTPTTWSTYGNGFTQVTNSRVDGAKSIYVTSSSVTATAGAGHYVSIGQSTPGAIRISGWSRSSTSISTPSDGWYSVYTDLTYTDSTHQYGVTAPFLAGPSHIWQYQCETIISDKSISSLNIYAMLSYHTGEAWFDKFDVSSVTLNAVVTSSTNPLKLLIPLYINPYSNAAAWTAVKAQRSNVDITIVANPNSGPGNSSCCNYADYSYYIHDFATATPPVKVLGYVHTSNGARPIADVKLDIDRWVLYYPDIIGIFLDEASTKLDDLPYYDTIQDYVITKLGGSASVFINPGASTNENYTAVSDNILFFESTYSAFSAALSSGSLPSGWVRSPCYSTWVSTWKYKSSAVVHTTSSSNYQAAVDTAISRGFGYVYVTDDVMPNPYDSLPSYWTSLVSYIQGKNV